MTDTTELRRLAEAATPGKWVADGDNVYHERLDELGRHIACAYVSYRNDETIYANAAFIAACSPDRILSLIAENERLREAVRRMTTTYAGMEDGDGEPCPDVAFSIATLKEYTNG